MPRKPYPVTKAGHLLEDWLALRVAKSGTDAPITVAGAVAHLNARGIKTHRDTLHKYSLTSLVAAASEEQAKSGPRRSNEVAAEAQILADLRGENERLSQHNRELLGVIAAMTYNAQRFNISDDELRSEMPKPNRTQSRAGAGNKRRK